MDLDPHSATSADCQAAPFGGFPAPGPLNAAEMSRLLSSPPQGSPDSLNDLLLAQGLINEMQWTRAVSLAHSGMPPRDAVRASGDVDEESLQQAYAQTLGLPCVDLLSFEIDQQAVDALPAATAREYEVMPLCFAGTGLVAAVEDPTDARTRECLTLSSDHPVELVVAPRDEIERAITRWYGPRDDQDALEQIRLLHPEDEARQSGVVDLDRLGRGKPVVRLVHNILMDAIQQQASDVHLRPLEERVDLLFRLDGALVKMRSFEKSMLPAIVSRIKIIGNMDIAEHRLPQDGRFRMSRDNGVVDLRLSIIPTVQGESVVIRILDADAGLKSLDALGFSSADAERFAELMSRTAGMVLVTGPTGCGKSTTLYAALQQVHQKDVNIVTVEDPVEYRLAGINQIQVNNATGLTFARALRHILRHDPDVVMVGEIRDLETAKMAVESSLTGHLVLSTLHTNDAASAVTRLLEIGIEPYLVNTSLMAVLAQRLVRRNCSGCIEPEKVDPAIRRALNVAHNETFFRGCGCSLCHGTGYRGRRAVYELLMVTPGLRERITAGASSADIGRFAESEGMQPLTSNALEMARAADTSLAEVYRVRLS